MDWKYESHTVEESSRSGAEKSFPLYRFPKSFHSPPLYIAYDGNDDRENVF